MLLLILGLFLFVGLVVVHEFGHFIAARRGGVEVEEFGVGFPPKLYGRCFKKGGTLYTINLLPLGGFVKLKGEHDEDTEEGSYGAARLSTKVKIMLAGVGMNLATAWLLLLFLALIGIPLLPLPGGESQFSVKSDSHIVSSNLIVSYVEPDSPAAKAGIEVQDRLVRVAPVACRTVELCEYAFTNIDQESSLREFTAQNAGKEVLIELKDQTGELKKRTVTLLTTQEIEASKATGNTKGYLGIAPYEAKVVRSTWSAPIVASGLTYQFTKLTLKGLGSAIKNLFMGHASEASENVSGPVGVFFVLKGGSTLGFRYIFLIIALISLTLAIMNVLPIPALDGGRLFVTLLFRKLKKPLTPLLEDRIHGSGFAALMLLFILITIVDVKRFF